MARDLLFSPNSAIVDNLTVLNGRRSDELELRLLELSDLAEQAAEFAEDARGFGLTVFEILSEISSGLNFGGVSNTDSRLYGHTGRLREILCSMSVTDRAAFCGLLTEYACGRGLPFGEDGFLPNVQSAERIVYVRNSLSDEAYDIFSQDFSDPRVRYVGNSKECVSAVLSGEADYCLLPLEERGGVRLPTVSELLYRNDLKINSVTPVFGFDGNAGMKYALVSRGFTVPERRDGDDRYLEIRIDADSDVPLSDILYAASIYGMTAYRVNSLSFDSEGENNACFSVVLRDAGRGFSEILVYLTLFVPAHTTIGLYRNLE